MKAWRQQPLVMWMVLLVAGNGLAGADAAEFPFDIAQAIYQDVPVQREFDGVVEAVHKSTVSAQTAGRIVEIYFDVDDHVPEGSELIRIHPAEQRARLDQSRANLREAEARSTRAREEQARIKNLFERKLASQADMDRADAELRQAVANVEAVKARTTEAQEQLQYTVITAPYSGVVVARHVQLGETVQVGTPLMTGFSLDALRVTASVPQDFVGAVRQDARAHVQVANGKSIVTSTDLTIFPVADPQSHGFKVRVNLPKGTPGLYPGMFTKVAFEVGKTQRLLIPNSALAQRSEVSGVYVVNAAGQVSLRQVLPGARYGEFIEVLAGLSAGETIALDTTAAAIYRKEQGN